MAVVLVRALPCPAWSLLPGERAGDGGGGGKGGLARGPCLPSAFIRDMKRPEPSLSGVRFDLWSPPIRDGFFIYEPGAAMLSVRRGDSSASRSRSRASAARSAQPGPRCLRSALSFSQNYLRVSRPGGLRPAEAR